MNSEQNNIVSEETLSIFFHNPCLAFQIRLILFYIEKGYDAG